MTAWFKANLKKIIATVLIAASAYFAGSKNWADGLVKFAVDTVSSTTQPTE